LKTSKVGVLELIRITLRNLLVLRRENPPNLKQIEIDIEILNSLEKEIVDRRNK